MTEAINGTATIERSADDMSAVCKVTPPGDGGAAVGVDMVKEALAKSGVLCGVIEDNEIESLLEDAAFVPVEFTVANGAAPGQGDDGDLALLWKETTGADPSDASEMAELQYVRTLKAGELIARKTPPTRGEEGTTVTGAKTSGEWGMNVSVNIGDNVVASEDGTEFRAGIDGSPKMSGGVLSVDPVQIVEGDADANLEFEGAVEIRGNVLDGVLLRAKGNVSILKNIQACDVFSGGDIVVRGGIITRREGAVIANGSVYAKFIENSVVEAEKDVVAERAIINSAVRANGAVMCQSKEGKIMGGEIMAFREIRARQLGTEKETPTLLQAGFNFDHYARMAELETALEKAAAELSRIQKALAVSKSLNPEAALELRKSQQEHEQNRLSIQKQIAASKSQAKLNPQAAVNGEEIIHPGCVVCLGSSKEKIARPLRSATLFWDEENGITLSAYDEQSRSIRTVQVGNSEKKKKALIVDDALFMRNKLKNILENANFKVVGEAADGLQAVQMFSKLNPDITTLDITMPNMDGYHALLEIKKAKPDAKVVMISALGQRDKVKDCIIAGANDFILKPFVPEKVVQVINRVFGE